MANPVVKIVLQAIDNATDQLTKVENRFKSFGSVVGGAMKSLGAVLATAAIGNFLKEAVTESLDGEKSVARLGLAVQNAGGNFKELSPALEIAIDGIKRLSTFSDGDLREALGGMITMTGDVAGSTANLGLVADLAAARQIDLSTASDMVAKAMNGNTGALNKLGVEGKTANEVIGNLAKSMGGAAATEAQTFGGQLQKLNGGWSDFKQAIGDAILGSNGGTTALGALGGALKSLTDFIVENQEAIGKLASMLGSLIEFTIKGTTTFLDFIIKAAQALPAAIATSIDESETEMQRGRDLIAAGTEKGLTDQQKMMKEFADLDAQDAAAHALKQQAIANAALKAKQLAAEAAAKVAKKEAEGAAAELRKINDELAVFLLIRQQDLTRQQATELVRRSKILAGTTKEIQAALVAGFAAIDRETTLSAAGFDQNFKPSLDRTRSSLLLTQMALSKLVSAPGASLEAVTKALNITADQVQALNNFVGDQKDFNKFAKEIGVSTFQIHNLNEGAKGLPPAFRDGAAALGIFDQKLGDVAGKAVGLVDSLMRAAGGNPTAIIGAVGTLAGLFSSLFGRASSDEAKRVLALNTTRLRELTDVTGDLVDAQTSGKNFSKIFDILETFGISSPVDDPSGGMAGALRQSPEALERVLREAGLTLKDLDKAAEDLGITLRDKSGNITGVGLKALMDAIQNLDTGIGKSFGAQLKNIDTKLSLGLLKPSDEVGALLGAAGADNLITKLLGGLDLGSAAGRFAGKQGLEQMFGDLASGKIKLGELGGLSRKEFEGLIVRLLGIFSSDKEIGNIAITKPRGGVDTGPEPTEFPNGPNVGPGIPDFSVSSGFGDTISAIDTTNLILNDILNAVATPIGAGAGTMGDGGRIVIEQTYNLSGSGMTSAEVVQATEAANRRLIDELLATNYIENRIIRGSAVRT